MPRNTTLRRLRQEDLPKVRDQPGETLCLKVNISVIKCHDQMQLGEERGCLILQPLSSHSIPKGSQARNSRQGPGEETEVEATKDHF